MRMENRGNSEPRPKGRIRKALSNLRGPVVFYEGGKPRRNVCVLEPSGGEFPVVEFTPAEVEGVVVAARSIVDFAKARPELVERYTWLKGLTDQ